MLERLKSFIIVTLLIFISLGSHAQKNNTTKYLKAKIHYTSSNFETLLNSGIAIDHGNRKSKKYVASVFSNTEIAIAKKLGFKVEILIDDMQKHIQKRNNSQQKVVAKNTSPCDEDIINYTTPTNFEVKASNQFGGFYTYSEILQELDDMRTAYPNLITARANISTFTTENGNTLQWVKISDNADIDEAENEILYNSLNHAREPASMQQLIFYMWYLLENYATDSEVKNIVDNTEMYFIPVVNPDGYLHNESTNPNGGGFWRKNRRDNGNGTFGVDNNRNFDYYINGNSSNGTWGGPGSSANTNSEIYRGTAPFSEPENQALKWFVEDHNFVTALNNHTFGELLYYPFSYADVATPDEAVFEAITNEFTSQNDYSSIRDNPFSGDSDDYMYGTVGTHSKIFAMTSEVGDSFWPAQNNIIAICKSMMYTNITAAHTINNYAVSTDTQENYLTSITGDIDYSIQRLGLTGSGNFTVSIVPISSNINSVGSTNAHNGLTLLENRTGTISYTLNPSMGIGEEVEYKIVINNGLYSTEKTIKKVFGTPQEVVSENGDTIINFNSSSWNTTTSEFVSASSSITDSPSGNYSNNQNSIIELSDAIDLTSGGIASISFYAKWDIEENFDYVQFEVSTNNGVSWQPQCGKYTESGVADQGVTGQPLYDGTQNDWIQEFIDLSDYLGETIKVRFQLVSDGGTVADGFYFDDFKVNVIDQSILGTDTFETLNAKIFPNPVKENITITITNPVTTEIKVYTITGQLVKQLKTDITSTELDLKNLKSGVYMLQLQTETSEGTYKIIKE